MSKFNASNKSKTQPLQSSRVPSVPPPPPTHPIPSSVNTPNSEPILPQIPPETPYIADADADADADAPQIPPPIDEIPFPDPAMMRPERGRSLDSLASSSSSPPPSSRIEHRVSKMDTLAGVAIKYGVEVADIRRLNGLVTDLQMFAHKSLLIPAPGRHSPSPVLANGDQTPPCQHLNDVFDSFQSLKLKPKQCKVSPAMSSLQGYYGLTPPPKRWSVGEGTEMSVYRSEGARCLENQRMSRGSPVSDSLQGGHRSNGDMQGVKVVTDTSDTSEDERPIRRRQKVDTDPSPRTPELLMKDDSNGGFSGRIAKSLAPRPKSGSRTDMDMGRLNFMPIVDSFLAEGWAAVRKSSSTSNLQESENGSYVWPPRKWSWNAEAIARPIFDGLPKPARRNKAALD